MEQLVTLRTTRHRMPETSEVTMASEHPVDDDLPALPRESTAAKTLRRALRLQLLRHRDAAAFAPPITLVGFRGEQSHLLRVGMHEPEEAVLGLILPSRFSAIGAVAASVVATPPRRDHRDAALALGVLRSGEAVSMLATPTGEITATSRPQGWLIDACRRAVGLRTAPCPAAALTFPIVLWLDRVMVALVNEPHRRITWNDVVAMCPVPGRWRSADAVDLGITLGSTTPSWAALRQATIRGHRAPVGIRPDHAEWMDDPMFARWCLGSFPELNSLRSDVEFLAPDDIAQSINDTLRAAWQAFAP